MKSLLTILATLLLGVGIGVVVQQRWLVPAGGNGADPASRAVAFPPPVARPPGRVPTPVVPQTSGTAEKTAEGPLAAALGAPTEFAKYAALYEAAAAADAQALREMIVAANGLDAPWDRRTFLSVLYRRYAELDPPAAVDLVLATPYRNPGLYLSAIFRAWAGIDLQASLDRLQTLAPWLKEHAGRGVFAADEVWHSGRREEIARSLGLEKLLRDVEKQWEMERSPSLDPATRWSALVSGGVETSDMRLYFSIVQQWVQTDPYAAMQAALALDNARVRSFVLENALQVWARLDGESAFDWAWSQPPGRLRSQSAQAALEGYARSSRERALELARRLDLRDRRVALLRIVLEWSESDPVGAARWVAGLPGDDVDFSLAQNVAHRYAAVDPNGAMRWAERLPAESSGAARIAVLRWLAATDPERAAREAAAIDDEAQRVRVSVEVAQAWAGTDPLSALRWLETAADAAARRQGQGSILASWVQTDPDAALAAHRELTDPQARDVAALRMLQSLSFYDAQTPEAEALYAGISDPEVKHRAATSLYSQWTESQPALAETYRLEAERLADDEGRR